MKDTDVKVGMRVVVGKLGPTTGMMIEQKHLDERVEGRSGVVTGYVPGHGGDVWWVKHHSGDVAAYSYTELEPDEPAPVFTQADIDTKVRPVETPEHAFVTRADAHDCSVCGLAAGDPCHKRVVSAEDRVRVLRLVEYEGPRAAVERQVAGSVQGTRTFQSGRPNELSPVGPVRITAVTLGVYPDVVEAGREVADPRQVAEMRAEIERLSAKVSSLQLSLYQHEDQSACRPEDL